MSDNTFKMKFKSIIKKFSPKEKHDCIDNREVIQHLPQYGRTINGHDVLLGDGYQVKCKICGKDWFQNYR